MRETLGPDVGIMVDAHGTWSVREAKRFTRKVEDCDLGWLEEPVSSENLAGQAEVRAATDIPIAAGESEQTRFAFRDMIAARAVDVCQPDVAIAGGITETQRIAALAAAHDLTVAPHLWGSAILFAAGLHLGVSTPCVNLLEFSRGHNPLLNDLVEERVELRGRPRPRPRRTRARPDPAPRLRRAGRRHVVNSCNKRCLLTGAAEGIGTNVEDQPDAIPKRILILDDDHEVAAFLAEFLEGRGYQVVTAHTGADGLALLQDGHVGLVLLDLKLPDMDGNRVMEEAHQLAAPPTSSA